MSPAATDMAFLSLSFLFCTIAIGLLSSNSLSLMLFSMPQ